MFKFNIPPKAFFLGLPMGLIGGILGMAVGSWMAPIAIAILVRHDLSSLSRVPRQMWIFPSAPSWYTHGEKILWSIGALLAVVIAGICGDRFLKIWRHLVVRRYKWMTDKEVDEFLKRGGDDPRQW